MFPWNYGFHWTAGTIIFMGAFYTVVAIVAATVVTAAMRTRRTLAEEKAEHIRWHSDFHDLPAQGRICRHVLTGEFKSRECPNGFDCRTCETHAGMIEKRAPAQPVGLEEEVLGMPYPLDRLYHRGHTWVHAEADGTVTVGLDELGRRLLGTPDAVDLPAPGAHVHANGTAFRVRKRAAEVRVLSPVDGEVIDTGGPDRGWYLKVKPADGHCDLRHLLCGCEIKPWLVREMERLQLALSMEGAAQPMLADGGVPVDDIAAGYPAADWDTVCSEMFLGA
jgi:glycine cleavage system H protein